jgi:hypothetical protein
MVREAKDRGLNKRRDRLAFIEKCEKYRSCTQSEAPT